MNFPSAIFLAQCLLDPLYLVYLFGKYLLHAYCGLGTILIAVLAFRAFVSGHIKGHFFLLKTCDMM